MSIQDSFLMTNTGKFHTSDLLPLRSKLDNYSNEQLIVISSKLKSPLISIVLSVTIGHFGIDRFYIGDYVYGVVKFIFCWAFILTLIDWFLIMGVTKKKNLEIVTIPF